MRAIVYRLRADVRTRWRAWLGLALLAGVVGGAIIGVAAGARRTESAYDRFLEAQDAPDAVYANDGNEGFAVLDLDAVAALPGVREVGRGTFFYVDIGPGIGAVVPRDDHLARDVARWKLLDGRLPRADAPDEAAISFALTDQYALHVGDTFPIYDPADELPPGLPPEDIAGYEEYKRLAERYDNRIRIVGVYAAPAQFPPQYGTGRLLVVLSPAFGDTFGSPDDDAMQQVAFIRLHDRARRGAGVDQLVADLEAIAPAGQYVPIETGARTRDVLQRSLHVQASALRLLAVLVGLGALLVVGQVLARNALLEAAPFDELHALGFRRRDLAVLACIRAAIVAAGAAVIAAIVAVVVSPLFPRGLARVAEPEPGFDVDGIVIPAGAGVVALMAVLAAALPAVWATRAVRRSPKRPRLGASTLRFGMPVSGVVGANFALVAGRGGRAVPIRTTMLAIALGVAAVVGSLTFGASLDHLLATPRLYGTTWDFALADWEGGLTAPGVESAIAGVRGIDAAAIGDGGIEVTVGDARADLFVAEPVLGDARPPVLDGRLPRDHGEVALGARTERRAGAAVGGRVQVAVQDGEQREFRVVGTVVLPATSDRGGLGEGVYLTLDGVYALVPQIAAGGGVSLLFVDVADGRPRDAVVEELRARLGDLPIIDARKPTDLVDFARVRGIPLALGLVLALVSSAALVHLLVTAVRRRRVDLATCHTMGFTRPQLAAAVAWQASITIAIAMIAGVPVGIASGRLAWGWLAHDLGVPFVARMPLVLIGAVVVGGFVLANAAAVLPARAAARTQPAQILRAE
jgi:hypothetical protein